MEKVDKPEQAKRLEQARLKRRFKTARAACEYFGWNYNTYSQHERGERGLTKSAAEKYAAAYHVTVGWLLTGEGSEDRPIVAIMGYIGAGAEIMPEFEQVPPEGLAEVELPFPVPDDVIGFEVRGDSMLPRYDEGDVVVVFREQRRATESLLGEEAAVRTVEGLRYLKRIMLGQRPYTYNLESFNARTIEGVRLDWIGEIWVTVRSGQIRRIERKERAVAKRKQLNREQETGGMDELPLPSRSKRQ